MIHAQGLSKRFKSHQKAPGFKGAIQSFFDRQFETKTAIENFDLEVAPGEIIGLLGPNGAGKTTLMKMFTGIIVPSEGSLNVLGTVPHKRSRDFRKQIALVMGQKSQLWWDLPALDSFLLLQKYYEIDKKTFEHRLNELSELLNVTKLLRVHVRKLSLGERMKLELMSSLLHDPKIIFLDEPTIGLDLVAQKNIRDFLLNYHGETGVTLILTSHYMADIQALAKRVVLVLEGQKRFDDSLEAFAGILGGAKMVAFRFGSVVKRQDPFFEPFSPLWNAEGTRVELNIPEDRLRELGQQILRDYPVVDFHTENLPIERVMAQLLERPELL
ncbi:MAG: multidrug ABC transporter ATP-binding protein [Candidatus Lambdaproteobacteria bacterium RIFOXYD2_FULL_50_16]|uniref:Multidrug ABC transporter ATP-binding protein n=1 Tax=Candidatus Lambdaproteobacteria bacterium RIFOXYD2_FULL_50_16 TaxID=1817772 RepID=A0A1F6G596_9PROT|nr:MAG: multidrug ABC transporter ATP-binding protein [Candidatus Lambdaproteobacteria bacterium RIFOXYD2_FULL_50_16]